MIFSYDKDKIYFALEEGELNSNFKYFEKNQDNLPCWHPHDGMLIYIYTRNYRIVDLIKYYAKVPSELSFETLHDFYEDVWNILQKNGYKKEDEFRLNIVLANSSEAYYVSKYGVTNRDDKLTYVSGDMSPEIAAHLPRELSALERIKEYYRAENEFYKTQNIPIMLFSTNEPGVKIVDL
jgi:hypothetical protein